MTKLGSGIYGETWANLLFQAIGDNQLLHDALTSVELPTTFPDNPLGSQLSALIKKQRMYGAQTVTFSLLS